MPEEHTENGNKRKKVKKTRRKMQEKNVPLILIKLKKAKILKMRS